jgi:hypothetical protein
MLGEVAQKYNEASSREINMKEWDAQRREKLKVSREKPKEQITRVVAVAILYAAIVPRSMQRKTKTTATGEKPNPIMELQ